jgi:hypothetical protein
VGWLIGTAEQPHPFEPQSLMAIPLRRFHVLFIKDSIAAIESSGFVAEINLARKVAAGPR